MQTGRPTEYNPKYCVDIVEYFDRPTTKQEKEVEYFVNGEIKKEKPIILAEELPTFQGFAHSIGVHVDTLHEWRKVHAEFSEAYSHAKALQEKIWLVNSMSGLYNAQFAQFFGKNCLGYKDKTETDIKAVVAEVTEEDAEKALKALGYGRE